MKQSFFIILSICFTCLALQAQTYYYKQVKKLTVSTFYKFRGKKNNLLVYQAYEEVRQIAMYGFVNTGKIRWLEDKFTFSSNRERANWKIAFFKYIRVFERANPEDIEVPDQLY